LGKGTKYRSPEKLIPCIIYFHYKKNNKPISEINLLEIAHISKKDFNTFKLQMLEMWPNYQERNRKDYILQRILEICEHFNLGINFYYQTKKILYHFYESIKNTKDDVIVGLVSSITLLCSERQDLKVCNICKHLNIKMSTIQTQVKKRIFKHFHVTNYISLIRSRTILKRIIIKLGILDPYLIKFEQEEEFEPEFGAEDFSRVVSLGSARPIFNTYDNRKYYVNVLKVITDKELMITLVIKPHYSLQNIHQSCGFRSTSENDDDNAILVELWKYQYPTGPPFIIT
jgi:hypothetical protein